MVANPVVVGSVVVVVGPVEVVVGPVLVVVGLVVVGRAVVVVGPVVLVEATVVEAAVVVGAVVVLGVVTGGCVVVPGVKWVLVTVVLLQGDAVGAACRPPVVIGRRLAAGGLVSGLLVGEEDWVVDSSGVVVADVGAGAGSVVAVGRATPGARFGGGA